MNTTRVMGMTTIVLSVTLLALFAQPSVDFTQDVFAENDSVPLIQQIQTQDNIL